MSPISVTVISILAAGVAVAADRAPTSARSASLSVRVVVLPHRDPRLYEPMPAGPVVDESRAPHLTLSRNLSIPEERTDSRLRGGDGVTPPSAPP